MRSKLALTMVCAAALAMPVQKAHAADPVVLASGSGCGGVQFELCAAWSLLFDGVTYSLNVTNNPDGTAPSSIFTQFAFATAVDNGLQFTLASGTTPGWTQVTDPDWELGDANGNPFNGAGMTNPFVFEATTISGVNGGTLSGGYTVINFQVTGGAFNPTQFGIHSQSGPESCSTKAVFNASGQDQTAFVNGNVCGGTTIPEPSTVVLLGTGIVGILAARNRRRFIKKA